MTLEATSVIDNVHVILSLHHALAEKLAEFILYQFCDLYLIDFK